MLSHVDPLADLADRQGLARFVDQHMRALGASAASMLLIEIDMFPSYSDRYSAQAADLCLRGVASTLQRRLRHYSDLLARLEGATFAAIIQGGDAETAALVAQRMQAAVYALGIPHAASPAERVTVSIGAAARRDLDLDALLAQAQAALQRAKQAGPGGLSR
ncbi:diguanylate cyclase [Chloroflexia bacterium SDU3-3]|nr:diguanylate cyclase [Chloroflexia bacterium SDU3-3]